METNTEKLIEALQLLEESIDSADGVANAVISESAERLNELQAALQTAHASLVLARNERDEARVEVKRLKAQSERLNQELYEAKGWYQDLRPDWVRKDPSRLEIAAMIYSAFAGAQCIKDKVNPTAFIAFKCADELIAAAKEEQ